MEKSVDFEAYLLQMADLPESFEDKRRLQFLLNYIQLHTATSLIEHLNLLPSDYVIPIQEAMVRWLCIGRSASADNSYYKFFSCIGDELTYFSKFLRMDGDIEKRVPRTVNGVRESESMRKDGKDIWVVEHDLELFFWMRASEGAAIVAKNAVSALDFA
jgi:hypothetical protein